MYPFKADLTKRQRNKSKGINTCEYIVLHHTATGYNSVNWNIKVLLGETSRQVSAHVLVDTNGDAYKLWDPKWILWHAWDSTWEGKRYLNGYSVGIEVIWPLPWFTDEQRHTILWLVQHLMAVLKIPKERVIRHKDISKWRKTDIDDSFFKEWFETWRAKLKPREYV